MGLVNPLHSGDPDVMQFSRSKHAASNLMFERPAPSVAVRNLFKSNSATILAAWGGAVAAAQIQVPNGS